MIIQTRSYIKFNTITYLLIFIGICYFIISYNTPHTSDDLYLRRLYEIKQEEYGILVYPALIVGKWLMANARMADNILLICLNSIPHWIFALLNAVFSFLMYAIIIKLSDINRQLNNITKLILIIFLTFALPWEGLLIHACWLNYIWSVAFSLSAVYYLIYRQDLNLRLSKSKLKLFFTCFLIFCSASMHEAAGFPLGCGIFAFLILNKSNYKIIFQNKPIKYCFISFLIGSIFVISSCGSYMRLSNGVVEVPFYKIVFANSWTFIMIILLSIKYLSNSKRDKVKQFIFSDNIILIIAAITSTSISLISHLSLRSAWFADIFAIIIIFRYLSQSNIYIPMFLSRLSSIILISIIVTHFSLFTYFQYKLKIEYDYAINQYLNSPDGIVTLNYISKDEIPPFVSQKTIGLYNSTDEYNVNLICFYYKTAFPIKIIQK